LHVTAEVESVTGDPFSGPLPFNGIFTANIPNDFEIPIYDPTDPMAMFVDSTVLMGYNPIDPEADAAPWEIPGLNVTGAWKYSRGRPDVLVAVIDDGIHDYAHPEQRRAFFLNAGELPLPNVEGAPCAQYDCNADGRFDVDDYAADDRVSGDPPYSAQDLIDTFSNDVDEDGNGLPDDISGWDFLRGVNVALGAAEFPEGTHGGGEVGLIVAEGNNGLGETPGICPNCQVLAVRVGATLIYDYNLVAAGVKYAASMGAKVLNFAGVNFTWSEAAHQEILDAFDAGALTVAASGDEMTFHHWMPAAGEDVVNVKTIFPMVPVELAGIFNLGTFGFTETYCTNYGTHVDLSVPAKTGCTSDSTGNTTGLAALLVSYAREQGVELSAAETRQILTMTADDIQDHCASLVNLLGVCQPGYDEHFGYGRPNAETALLALGDPDLGIAPALPPAVRITYPKWWQTIDPVAAPNLDVTGSISARVTPFDWEVQVAAGRQPLDDEFITAASGTSATAIDGSIATIPIGEYFPRAWASGTPDNQYTFEVTLRVRARYVSSTAGTVWGQARKSISVHVDDDPQTGLATGFPLDLGASGESAPLLYDLDGAPDRRLEIVFGLGDGRVMALTYDEAEGAWANLPGFPVDLAGDDAWVRDGIFASAAVGDLFGDGTPEIVVATMLGKVYALDPARAAAGNPILDGFPVSADEPDNTSPFTFAYGNGFIASPVLVDLDRDGVLEIVAASLDQKTYAWKPAAEPGEKAAPLAGWPVLCRSIAGLVPPDKVCHGNDLPNQIIGTPAAGILDPDHDDLHIREYPAVVVASAEACDGPLLPEARVYAIYHNGLEHPDGPFLPGWPAKPVAPLGTEIPLPMAVGSVASPNIIRTGSVIRIAVASTAWFPQIIHYAGDATSIEPIPILIAINAVGSSAFSSLQNDGTIQYVLPLVGVLRFDELGFQLFNSRVIAMNLDRPHDQVLEGQIEDLPMLGSPVVADLDNDGRREVINGTGGYLAHAFAIGGGEADGWPKYTQKWLMASPAVGDLDADGKIEVIAQTREGVLYAWESEGATCPDGRPNSDWRRHHHDERNSGDYGLDAIPPFAVSDLAAIKIAADQIRLTFTAVGDDWNCGAAASYDIRYATDDGADLTDPAQFTAATAVTGAPAPSTGGAAESFDVSAPGARHFALRVFDEAGNGSRISNDAVVEEPVDDDTSPDDDTPDDDDDDDDNDDNDDNDDAADDDLAADDDNDDDTGCGC
jgi:hypothetical protein